MQTLIKTPCGEIQGPTCQWDGVIAFKGIRYATAERFKYPELVTEWDGIYDATKYGNCSYQPRAFYDEEKMLENPGVLLTPIVRNGKKATVGYEPETWQSWIDEEKK